MGLVMGQFCDQYPLVLTHFVRVRFIGLEEQREFPRASLHFLGGNTLHLGCGSAGPGVELVDEQTRELVAGH